MQVILQTAIFVGFLNRYVLSINYTLQNMLDGKAAGNRLSLKDILTKVMTLYPVYHFYGTMITVEKQWKRNDQVSERCTLLMTSFVNNESQRIPKVQSKMDNAEKQKLAALGTQDDEKQKHSTICVLDITIHKQTQIMQISKRCKRFVSSRKGIFFSNMLPFFSCGCQTSSSWTSLCIVEVKLVFSIYDIFTAVYLSANNKSIIRMQVILQMALFFSNTIFVDFLNRYVLIINYTL